MIIISYVIYLSVLFCGLNNTNETREENINVEYLNKIIKDFHRSKTEVGAKKCIFMPYLPKFSFSGKNNNSSWSFLIKDFENFDKITLFLTTFKQITLYKIKDVVICKNHLKIICSGIYMFFKNLVVSNKFNSGILALKHIRENNRKSFEKPKLKNVLCKAVTEYNMIRRNVNLSFYQFFCFHLLMFCDDERRRSCKNFSNIILNLLYEAMTSKNIDVHHPLVNKFFDVDRPIMISNNHICKTLNLSKIQAIFCSMYLRLFLTGKKDLFSADS